MSVPHVGHRPAQAAAVGALAHVDGWAINIPTQDIAIQEIIAAARSGEGFNCVTLNLDHLVKLRQSAGFRRAYASAKFVTADGAPVAMIARRQAPQIERTTGADLFMPLCRAAAAHDVPVYLFGTSSEVLDEACRSLRRETGGRLKIAGYEAPPMGFDPAGRDAEAAIRRSGARLCFVMLGAPKQELFAARAVASGARVGFVCVGAAGDFIVGRESRAPQLVQSAGLEWLWRLVHSPRRLAMRYMRCALLLARIELAYRTETAKLLRH